MPSFSGNGTQSVAYSVSSEQVYGVVSSDTPQDVLLAVFGIPSRFVSPLVNDVGSNVVPQLVAIPTVLVDVGTVIEPIVSVFVSTLPQQLGTEIAPGVPALISETQDTGTEIAPGVSTIQSVGSQDVKFFVDTIV